MDKEYHENDSSQTVTNEFINTFSNSNHEPCLLETDDRENLSNKLFIEILKKQEIYKTSLSNLKGQSFP